MRGEIRVPSTRGWQPRFVITIRRFAEREFPAIAEVAGNFLIGYISIGFGQHARDSLGLQLSAVGGLGV